MRHHLVFRYIGLVLLFNACFLMVATIISAFSGGSGLFALAYSTLVLALFGIFPLIFVPRATDLTGREGFVIVVGSWLLSCLTGMLPYLLWGGEFTVTNAWFESVSGFTTTGSTILNDIEAVPRGLLFWRAATHWIGGVGIIVFVLAVLPSMGKADMILYRAEVSPLAKDSFHARTKSTLQMIVVVYAGLTLLETIGLLLCGVGLFDALTHAFATVATGGFSTKNASIAHFGSISVELVVMVFMVLSGMHFGLLFAGLRGEMSALLRSEATRYYLGAMSLGIVVTGLFVHGSSSWSWSESLRLAAFQIISLGTSTGFATTDTNSWPPIAKLLMVFFTLQCACAGSTSGGIKVDRIVVFWKGLRKRLTKIRHPQAVIVLKVNGGTLEDDILEACLIFVLSYLAVVFAATLLLAALGVDLLTGFTAAAATMGNVGPGFGLVGSMGNFAQIPTAGKWILSCTMLLGRLEIFGILLFISGRVWR